MAAIKESSKGRVIDFKEDLRKLLQISESFFLTNFPPTASEKELWDSIRASLNEDDVSDAFVDMLHKPNEDVTVDKNMSISKEDVEKSIVEKENSDSDPFLLNKIIGREYVQELNIENSEKLRPLSTCSKPTTSDSSPSHPPGFSKPLFKSSVSHLVKGHSSSSATPGVSKRKNGVSMIEEFNKFIDLGNSLGYDSKEDLGKLLNVENFWSSPNDNFSPNPMIRFKQKLKGLKGIIKRWNKERNKEKNEELLLLESKLKMLDISCEMGKLSAENLVDRKNIIQKLASLDRNDGMDLAQKAKLSWAK
ncbi:hypothetical protein L1987_78092 [Smallanthus sonchifolius]|uniref:Uncharacterized protein n=1 Tax=Smallanthus sonchifolius TaxID=185202 RepID=A0ACB8ZBR2_9ASTR|nr:hypothetical protein L1987_78092 [Smallanthus sonchifolius]